MSRIGRQQITIPEKTEVHLSDGRIVVKSQGGELSRPFPKGIGLTVTGNIAELTLEDKNLGALWGTSSAHLKNMVAGVNVPFTKQLIIEGIGFRAEISGTTLTLLLGFSHPVKVEVPVDLKVTVEKSVLTVSGSDKERVGQFAAKVRALKKPEPYKGKGIRYSNEVVKRKEGKRSTT